MEKDKNTQDLEKFVRGQLDGLRSEPNADTWSKIAGRQQPVNTWLRFRFYGIRLAILLGTVVAVWAGWKHATAEPTSKPPSDPATYQNVVQNSGNTGPNGGIIDSMNVSTLGTTASHLPKTNAKRPDWYRKNTVPMQVTRFTAEQGIQYQSPVSRNTVRIPANVLVYSDGSPVTGAVDLLFREYRSIADFLAAGMPMHYTDDRGTFFFNSGGMFEVRVSQNGADLFIAQGKNYEVDFAPTAALRDASLFYLPDSSNQWGHMTQEEYTEIIPTDATTGTVKFRRRPYSQSTGLTGVSGPRILTENEVAADNRNSADRTCLPDMWSMSDTADAIAWLQDGLVTGREYAFGKIEPPLWFRKNSDKPDAFFLWALDRSNIRIVHEFDVDRRFFPDDLENVFSELSAFKGYYFTRLTDSTDALWRPDPENSVEQIFSQPHAWKKVTVHPQENARCLVVFGDEKEQISIPARLCRSNDRISSPPFNPSAVFAEYERLRDTRHRNIITEIRRWRRFVTLADIWQTPQEWCMPVNAWFDYFDDNKKMMRQRYDSLSRTGIVKDRTLASSAIENWKEQVRQLHLKRLGAETVNQSKMRQMTMTLRLTGFGTHNWDQIFQLVSQERSLRPIYQTLDGKPIAAQSARIIDRERNLFFSMPESSSLLSLPGRSLDVIVTAMNGRIYYLPGKTYAGLALGNQREFTFKMQDVTDKVETPVEWAELLGI